MSAHAFSFHLPALSRGDATAHITGDENNHLRRVLRLRAGETIRITNGRGLLVRATLASVTDRESTARVEAVEADAAPAPQLVLALPLLARAHFDAALAQCVEAGVTGFIPLLCEKGHVRAWTPALAARAQRVAVAAMKQSGRAWLPPFAAAATVAELAAALGGYRAVFLADAAGDPAGAAHAGGDTLAIVGPEAGFSAPERELLLGAGARPVSVSRHRLRSETAALVLTAWLARPGV